jgi:glycosyltransferase involved in cell wall biosynthesis
MPTLSTFHSGIPELIRHEESGLLSEEGDIAALTANTRKLLEEPGLWEHLTVKGRQMVEQNFNLTTNLNKVRNLLQDLAN